MPISGYFSEKSWGYEAGFSIPWEMLIPHEKQAVENHGQSLCELAKRGGLNEYEAILILRDKPLYPWPFKGLDQDKARYFLKEMIKEYEQRNHH